jgi:pyrroline-5-carboxylate reductase
MQTITFIGNGNMGLSIAQGLKGKYALAVVGRDMSKLEAFEDALEVKVDKYLLDDFDITDRTLLLCVKPANVEEVGKKLTGKADLLISVLAGTTVETLKKHFDSKATVRSMPNLAASVGQSMTTLTGDNKAKVDAIDLLSAIGTTLWQTAKKR